MGTQDSMPVGPLQMARQGRLLGAGGCHGGVSGTGLGMCGNIHPNLGPLRTALVNVTSLSLRRR